jgi:hypothetical protein
VSEQVPADLPDLLDYTGEFGAELVLFLPFIRWLSETGQLGDRTVRTYVGMRPFYEGLGIVRFEEKPGPREPIFPWDRPAWYPIRNEHDFDGKGRSPRLDYGDMRRQFAALPLPGWLEARLAEKPLLIIHNKYNDEWEQGPVNYIDLDTLDHAFAALTGAFTVLYIRHGLRTTQESFVEDSNIFAAFGDAELLDRYPDVLEFDGLFEDQRDGGLANVNAFKAALYSRCHRFVTVQGGGTHQIAQYSGSLIVILHRMGRETLSAYATSYYTFMAAPPPRLLVCARRVELAGAIDMLARASLRDGRIALAPADETKARKLDPKTAAARSRRGWLRLRYGRSWKGRLIQRLLPFD